MKTVNDTLLNMQKRLDAEGKTIKFTENYILTKPHFIKSVLITAFDMKPTIKTGKRCRPQQLGSTRSLQDLYLLSKHYFPEATIFDVRDALKEMKVGCSGYCYTFGKIMFHKYGYSGSYPPYGI